ncbi:hypothetical protein L6452_31931 [Arctium lappa]|uniref:Uncharacterized protein n=1 Tax=Arctium lappa TaxID=4217 RepID=A0ACB8Z2B6_ARCLA|nr:hypothetical protein L6452_31931 [Arctium lappa]
MKDFDHLKIQLEDVLLATENFGRDRQIGCGGFGQVYKGKLTLSNRRRAVVAFKRLDRKFGQGNIEFWKEIMMLSNCTHENLLALGQQNFDPENDVLVNIAKRAVHPLSYTTHHELHSLLSQGILVAGRETWLSVNKSEGIREMISAIKCVSGGWLVHETVENSRFSNVLGGLMR